MFEEQNALSQEETPKSEMDAFFNMASFGEMVMFALTPRWAESYKDTAERKAYYNEVVKRMKAANDDYMNGLLNIAVLLMNLSAEKNRSLEGASLVAVVPYVVELKRRIAELEERLRSYNAAVDFELNKVKINQSN